MQQVISHAPESLDKKGPKELDEQAKKVAKGITLGNARVNKDDDVAKQELALEAAKTKASQASELEEIHEKEAKPKSDTTEAAQLDPAMPVGPQELEGPPVPPELQAALTQQAAPAAPAAAEQTAPPALAYSGETAYDDPLSQLLAESLKPDPTQQKLERKLAEAFETRMGQSQGEINNLKKLAGDLAKPTTATDYSSIIRALDAFSGEDNIKYYTPPKDPKEELLQQAAMQEKIAKLQGGMTDDQVNFLKTQLSNKTQNRNTQLLLKLKAGEQRQSRYEDKRLNSYNMALVKDFDKIDENVRKGSLAYNNLSALLAPDANGQVDSQKVKQALSIFARKISGEKGVLTEKDVGRVLPRNIAMDWATVRAYLNPETPSEKLGGAFVKNLRQAITAVRGNEVEAWRANIQAKRKRGVINRFSGDLWKPGSEWDIISRDKIAEIETAYGDTGDFSQPAALTAPVAPVQGAAPTGPAGQPPGMGIDDYFNNKGKQ